MKKVKNNSTVAEKEALNSNAFEGGIGLVSTGIWIADLILDEDIQENTQLYADAGTLNTNTGNAKGVFNLGEKAFANANVAKAQAGIGKICNASISFLEASTQAQYGLNNSLGVSFIFLRVQANFGPISIGAGLSLDFNIRIGINGIGVSIFGFGFDLGPEIKFKTPFFDFSLKLW